MTTVLSPRYLSAIVLLALTWTSGCGLNDPPQFRLNLEGRDPSKITPVQRRGIEDALAELFGTPNDPKTPEGAPLDPELLRIASGPVGNDVHGNPRGLFRQYCAACHGISGGGDGPNAALLSPYPRDYRRGIFKFTSTTDGAKPTSDDLRRTILRGIPGTAMPSFAQLSERDIDALVEYVKYLSIRGETELYLLSLVVDQGERPPLDLGQVIDDEVAPVVEAWESPEKNPSLVVNPPPPPATDRPEVLLASIARGKKLYAGKEAQCVKCHGPEGRGDGEQKDLYDDWEKPKKGVTPVETAELAGRFTLPIQQIRPRNFTEGIYHGGSRPIDLYRRICVGIKGTPMPAAGPSQAGKGALTAEEIWDVVSYVKSLRKR